MPLSQSYFPNLSGTDHIKIRYCDIRLVNEQVTITRIWRRAETQLKDLPPVEVVEKGLAPGQAVIVEDVLYAFVRPLNETSSADETASTAPPAPAAPTVENGAPFSSGEQDASTTTTGPAGEQSQAVTFNPTLAESVDLAERLTRLSLMLCDQQERYMKQHVERVRRFDEYVEARSRKLDVRSDKLTQAQERHLETLREVTKDVTASVRLVGSQQFPSTPPGMPDDYMEARARLAASARRPVDVRNVARTIGTLLTDASAFFEGATPKGTSSDTRRSH